MFSWIRAHARLLAPLAILIAFATIAVPPAQALWSSVATPRVTVEAVGPSQTEVPGTSVATATPDPNATPQPCDQQALENLSFSGHISLTGEGPFDATLHLTNGGDETAHDVIVGLATISGWGFLQDVDFGNGQPWWIHGHEDHTLYEVGDIDPGETADIEMHIQMRHNWSDASSNEKALISATVFGPECKDLGDTAKIRLRRGESGDQTQQPEVTQTREPHGTPTRTHKHGTETPAPETTETPTPVTTDTATATATATLTATTVGVARVSTATPTSAPTKPPATKTPSPVSTTLAAAAIPSPSNHVLGTDAVPPPTGQALPATGSGLPGPTGSRALATLVLLAVAGGFVTIAAGVGRRLT